MWNGRLIAYGGRTVKVINFITGALLFGVILQFILVLYSKPRKWKQITVLLEIDGSSSFDLIKRALAMDFDWLTVKKATAVFFSLRMLDLHSVTKKCMTI